MSCKISLKSCFSMFAVFQTVAIGAGENKWPLTFPTTETTYQSEFYSAVFVALVLAGMLAVVGVMFRRLRKRQKFIQQLLSALPVRIYVCDVAGEVLFQQSGSGGAAEKNEFINGGFLLADRTFPEHREKISNTFQKVITQGGECYEDFKYPYKTWRAFFSQLEQSYFRHPVALCVLLETTEQSCLKRAAQLEAERYKLTLSAIGDAVIVTDEQENITMMNPVAEKLTGCCQAEAIGKPLSKVFNIISYLDESSVESPLRKATAENRVVELANHTDLIAVDGTRRHITDSAAPIRDHQGKIFGGILVFRDVTGEYDMRDKMRQSHHFLQTSSQIAQIGYFSCDMRSCSEFYHELPVELWPRRGDEALPPEAWLHPDDLAVVTTGWEALRGKTIRELNLHYRSRDGAESRYFHLCAQWSRNEFNNTDVILGLVHDVTEYKRSEMARVDSLNMMEAMFNASESAIFVKDVHHHFRYVFVNDYFCRIYNWTREDVIGKTDFDLFGKTMADLLGREDEVAAGENFEVIRSIEIEGRPVHHKVLKTPFRKNDGAVLLLGMAIDIEDVKSAQARADDTLMLLDNMLNNMHSYLFAKDITENYRYILANDTFGNLCNLTSKSLIGKYDEDLFPAELAQKFRADDIDTVAMGHKEVFEDVVHDGRLVHLQTHKAVYRNHAGHDILVGIGIDVSELRQAEVEQQQMIVQQQRYIAQEAIVKRCLELILQDISLNEMLERIMAEAGIFFQADRAYIFEYNSTNTHLSNTVEWCNAEVMPQKDFLQNHPKEDFPCWHECLQMHGKIVIDDIERIPKGMEPLYCFLQKQSIQSLLVVSIRGEAGISGFIGFDYVKAPHAFERSELGLLEDIANIIAIAYEQQAYKAQLENHVAELKRTTRQQDKLLLHKNTQQECFELLTREGNFDDALNMVVPKIGALFGADTCAVFVYDDENSEFYTARAWWNKYALENPLGNILRDPLRHTRAYIMEHEYLYAQRDVCFDDPDIQRELTHYFADFQVNTLLCRRLVINGEVWGHVGLHSVNDIVCGPDEVMLLHALGHTLELYIVRDQVWNQVIREERLKNTIFESTPIPLIMFDAAMNIVAANSSAKDFIGTDDIYSHPCYDLLCHDKENFGMCHIRKTLQQGKPQFISRHCLGRDLQISTMPIWENGKITGALQALVDISEQKENRRLLEEYLASSQVLRNCMEMIVTNSELQKIIDAIAAAIGEAVNVEICIIARHEDNVIKPMSVWQPSGSRPVYPEQIILLDDIAEKMKTEPLFILDAQDFETMSSSAREVISAYFTRFNIQAELCARIIFKGEIWGQISFLKSDRTPFSLPQKKMISEAVRVVEVLLLRNNLDRQLQNKERDLRTALEAAQSAERAKSTFLATMSHEIRTPLNAVIGFSELLQNENMDPREQREYLNNINIAGNALLRLINDILDLSKLEADKLSLNREYCDLSGLISDVAAIFKHVSRSKNLPLVLDFPEDLPLCYTDIQRLRQILLNLIGNAMKFTEVGEVKIIVELQRQTDEYGDLSIRIADTGIGISEANRINLFNPFIQHHNARGGQVFQGTGLGLAISKRLAEKMNGELLLQSVPGKGSVFTLRLPGMPLQKMDVTISEDNLSPAVESKKSRRLRALLVDDVMLNLQVLQAMLRQMELDCVQATSGAEALRLVSDLEFDLIITDVWMPEMNGPELVQKLRGMEKFHDMPIFAVTADIETKANFDMTQFSGVLTKPITLNKLKELLARV